MKRLSETMKDTLVENVTRSYGIDWSQGRVLLFTDRLRTTWALEDRGLAVLVPMVRVGNLGRRVVDGMERVLTYEGIRIGVELATERGVKFPPKSHV